MINTVVIRGPVTTGYLPHPDWESAFETYAAVSAALEATGVEVEVYDADGDQYEI